MQGNFIPKNLKLPEPKPAPKPQPKVSSSGEHVQLFRMVYDHKKRSKPNSCRLRILHYLCQHGSEPEIFMFPRLSCVCMHLEMWAEVKAHSYHAHPHVCVGSCMCCAQATPLSKLQ